MNPRSPRAGELVAGAGGALLLIAMFLPWFALDAAVELPGRSGGVTVRGEGVDAWHSFAVIDLVLFATVLMALVLVPLAVAGARTPPPLALAVTAAGLLCAVLVVYRLIDPPDLVTAADTAATETGRRLGPFFALLAIVAISWGGRRALEEGEEEVAVPEAEPAPREEPAAPVERPSGPPIRSTGVAAFDDLIGQLEPLLDRLWKAPAAPRAEHSDIPKAPGVYLFTRRDAPVHVGQAEDLRKRLAEQCRPSSGHTKATLAFEIAKRAATREGIAVDGPPARLATGDDFSPYFTRAKEAVAELPVRFVEVDLPELRMLFAVYGSLALGTGEYGSTDAD